MFSVGQLPAESLTRRKGQPAQVILLWEPSELPVLGGPQALVLLWVPSTMHWIIAPGKLQTPGSPGRDGVCRWGSGQMCVPTGHAADQLDSERGRLEGSNESKVLSYKWQNERNHAESTEGRT